MTFRAIFLSTALAFAACTTNVVVVPAGDGGGGDGGGSDGGTADAGDIYSR